LPGFAFLPEEEKRKYWQQWGKLGVGDPSKHMESRIISGSPGHPITPENWEMRGYLTAAGRIPETYEMRFTIEGFSLLVQIPGNRPFEDFAMRVTEDDAWRGEMMRIRELTRNDPDSSREIRLKNAWIMGYIKFIREYTASRGIKIGSGGNIRRM